MNLVILSIIIIIIITTIYSNSFYRIVIILAVIILIGVLVIVGYALSKIERNNKFPPVTADCPDYWISDTSGCLNPKNLGTCPGSKNFNTNYFNNHNGNCKKAEWAKNCGLTWQGITTDKNICTDSNMFDIFS